MPKEENIQMKTNGTSTCNMKGSWSKAVAIPDSFSSAAGPSIAASLLQDFYFQL